MSQLTDQLEAITGRLKHFTPEALADIEAVMSHGEGPQVLSSIAKVAGYNVPPGTITAFGSAFSGFLNAIVPPANGAPQTV